MTTPSNTDGGHGLTMLRNVLVVALLAIPVSSDRFVEFSARTLPRLDQLSIDAVVRTV
jgi:hypothetical protein